MQEFSQIKPSSIPKLCLSIVCVLVSAGENGNTIEGGYDHRYMVAVLQHTYFRSWQPCVATCNGIQCLWVLFTGNWREKNVCISIAKQAHIITCYRLCYSVFTCLAAIKGVGQAACYLWHVCVNVRVYKVGRFVICNYSELSLITKVSW